MGIEEINKNGVYLDKMLLLKMEYILLQSSIWDDPIMCVGIEEVLSPPPEVLPVKTGMHS